jgi:branched-chain amino acid transport system substrate-binding protein
VKEYDTRLWRIVHHWVEAARARADRNRGVASDHRGTDRKGSGPRARNRSEDRGQECDPLIFCIGPVPAQQLDPLIPWLMQRSRAKRFYLPSADYIWPHIMNKRVRELVTANGGMIVGEEYYPLDHVEYGETVRRIMASGADVVFNTIVPPGLVPFFRQLHDAGFTKRGGQLVCTYFDENLLALRA